MAQGLTEQQTTDLIKELEELGTESALIDEILHVVGSADSGTTESLPHLGGSDSRSTLTIRLMEEKDWRKRAALAALIISNEL